MSFKFIIAEGKRQDNKRGRKMINIGCHLSVSKGYESMGNKMKEFGGDTFAFFLRNPRGGSIKELDEADMQRLCELMKENSFGKLVAHAPYTMNPCAAKPELREYAFQTMKEDIERMGYLPGNYYNFHPGSHVGQGAEEGIKLTAEMLKRILDGKSEKNTTQILIETMSGKGSEIGRTFEEIEEIIDLSGHPDELGVCLDTCHIWDGGYDIVDHLDGVVNKFDSVIGLEKLKAVHINDSMNVLGAHKDRHEKIGQGCIGADALRNIVTHPALQDRPFILETPQDDEGYKYEISMIKKWSGR